ncbi:acetyltransferase [Xenorhabdus griffiniae]|uniref:acetyltransferase n=1 Tax=Xenorhabdus griffiniae TaxID=351672 RepID=UPI0023589E6B|nr:acetyltransferase [Xenorhabdus griffiniae]MDC9604379.1 acetyltransferase [Xenorhabdus griffiniae]
MLTLKYRVPMTRRKADSDINLFSVFDCQPQSCPSISEETVRSLGRLLTEIRRRLKKVYLMTCHPHRIGKSNCISINLEDGKGHDVNLLITVSGEHYWPKPEEYKHPRWFIHVADTTDAIYLILLIYQRMKE